MHSLYVIVTLSVAWLALCVVMWRLHRSRLDSVLEPNASILITYASQTGNAQAIAKRCATALNISETSSVIALNALTLEHLTNIEKILFVVSTYGDGEAPDNGSLFTKLAKILSSKKLTNLQYSVIALGDSEYPEFCAFGYQINQTMLNAGAQSMGNVITVDNYNEQTTKLASITPDWIKIEHELTLNPEIKPLQYWQLTKREVLNPDCNDAKLFQLSFSSIGPFPCWQAGDLLDIQPQQPHDIVERWLLENNLNGNMWLTHQGHQQSLRTWLLTRELPKACPHSVDELLNELPYLHKRSYSVASISQEGQLELIVRLVEKNDVGVPEIDYGLTSGFLSHYCQVGSIIEGQIRDVSSHHHIDQSKPMILIGAGSGLAGLKAQIAARNFSVQKQVGKIWLIFGERNSSPLLPINQQLSSLQETQLTKLSCAYSKDVQYPKYVQDILLNEKNILKQWLDDGAVIYVCGSLTGMGESVHQTLIEVLGQSSVEELQLQQRYIRDVY
jgi:sulfite reductase (NADPH) flavoprotein alpha-component